MSPDDSEAVPLLDLEKINAQQVARAGEEPDDGTWANLHNARKRSLELKEIELNMEQRKKYAFRVFALSCVWVTAILVLLILQGFGAWFNFKLSEAVLLASIGSTTVNVLGIFYIVVRSLFPKKP